MKRVTFLSRVGLRGSEEQSSSLNTASCSLSPVPPPPPVSLSLSLLSVCGST